VASSSDRKTSTYSGRHRRLEFGIFSCSPAPPLPLTSLAHLSTSPSALPLSFCPPTFSINLPSSSNSSPPHSFLLPTFSHPQSSPIMFSFSLTTFHTYNSYPLLPCPTTFSSHLSLIRFSLIPPNSSMYTFDPLSFQFPFLYPYTSQSNPLHPTPSPATLPLSL